MTTVPLDLLTISCCELHAMTSELLALREQVTALQARGTEQLMLARSSAFEAAAKECDEEAAGSSICEAAICARHIRELAKR